MPSFKRDIRKKYLAEREKTLSLYVNPEKVFRRGKTQMDPGLTLGLNYIDYKTIKKKSVPKLI